MATTTGYIDYTEQAVPASPSATHQRFYVNSTSHAPKLVNSSGVEKYFPGYEIDYVQITSPVSVTSTVEGTCTTCITGTAITYDGNTKIMIEVYAPFIQPSANAAGDNIVVCLFDGATNIGRMAYGECVVTAAPARYNLHAFRELTPSNASHTYAIKAFVSNASGGNFEAGAGASGNSMPAFLRITAV